MEPADQHASAHGHDEDDTGVAAEMLDLEALVLAEHAAAVARWLPVREPPSRVVDLGCGTGAGTFTLLDRFPEAHVTAVDASAGHLQRLREKACAQGLDGRVQTVRADLDDPGWPDLGPADLVWASASMHHLARPGRVLGNVYRLLTSGGLFAVVELSGFPRFLPENQPEDRPGLEKRCHEASGRFLAKRMPHRGADWGPMLTKAGFTVEGERTITVNIDASRNTAAVRAYALLSLQRIRRSVADVISHEDLTALDRLLDTDAPDSIMHRHDLAVRTERLIWAARRLS